MPFGEIVVGSPGSGKSTYCYGKHQLFSALNRPISIVNLDPANDNIPYPCAVDIASLITLQDVMAEHGLGPNGGTDEGICTAASSLLGAEHEPQQSEADSRQAGEERLSGRPVFSSLFLSQIDGWGDLAGGGAPLEVRLGAALIAKAMPHHELPHINVLSKVDLLTQYGDLGNIPHPPIRLLHVSEMADFNIEFYTEAQDLSHLGNALSSASPRYVALNTVIWELIEDFSLVGFETIAVEDKHSMLNMTRAIDRATGCVFVPPPSVAPDPAAAPSSAPKYACALVERNGPHSEVRDVKERWVDVREE
ncbi:Conserved hypothetical ATP binding domain containing protein [Lactarius tabidus]